MSEVSSSDSMSGQSDELKKSRKLVRCQTENGSGTRQLRYVELENFRLWEFLMTEKHNLKVIEPVPCLWVEASQFAAKSHLYAHSSNVTPVNRVAITIYDRNYGFEHVCQRYVYAFDTDQLVTQLKKHSRHMQNHSDYNLQIIEGYSIEQWVHDDVVPFVLGLAD